MYFAVSLCSVAYRAADGFSSLTPEGFAGNFQPRLQKRVPLTTTTGLPHLGGTASTVAVSRLNGPRQSNQPCRVGLSFPGDLCVSVCVRGREGDQKRMIGARPQCHDRFQLSISRAYMPALRGCQEPRRACFSQPRGVD
jgi:hypothetical protein